MYTSLKYPGDLKGKWNCCVSPLPAGAKALRAGIQADSTMTSEHSQSDLPSTFRNCVQLQMQKLFVYVKV